MNQVLKYFLCFLGFLWVFPVNVLAWIFLLILYAFGQIEGVWVCDDLAIIWDVKDDSKFHKLMSGWYGFVLGSNIVCIQRYPKEKYDIQIKHETAHVYQNYIFGVFYYPTYVFISTFMYFFIPKSIPYYENIFEIWARKYAGQKVKIPEDKRRELLKDRWPWW